MDEKQQRIEYLEGLLREASTAYYNSAADSIMSDYMFDQYRDELEELDPQNPFLAEVGAPPTDAALTKVKHSIPMGSLKKINAVKELDTWRSSLAKAMPAPPGGIRFQRVAIQCKLDGVSIELVYKNGKFVQAITRGDGEIGEDVTHTIKKAKNLPQKISVTDKPVYVRCEAILFVKDWAKHFSEKANPRNAASGLVRRSDSEGSEHINCIAFDVLFDDNQFKTEEDKIEWLKTEKFVPAMTVVCHTFEIEQHLENIQNQRDDLPYEIDGAVIKVNNLATQEQMGSHHGRPYWARAWKYPPVGGHTTIEGVEWSVGTRGTINPVAQVAPVSVGGTTIRNVTLHNMDEIERLGVKIGDTVEVIRANDVIPKVVRVVSKGKKRQAIEIDQCPGCGAKAVRESVHMVCSQKEKCSAVNLSRIKKWVSKRRILYLGDSNIESLVKSGVVNNIPDLYSLTPEKMKKGGVTEGMAKKILEQIDNSRKCSLSDLIGSLSLDMLGRSQAKILIEQGIDTLDKWRSLTVAKLEELPGFQRVKATRIIEALTDHWDLIEAVSQCITLETSDKPATGKLGGLSFCFTGTMQNPRKELEKMVLDAGGEIKSVSKNLTYLVIADPSSQSSKAKKARDLGVKLISEAEFLKRVTQ